MSKGIDKDVAPKHCSLSVGVFWRGRNICISSLETKFHRDVIIEGLKVRPNASKDLERKLDPIRASMVRY